MAGLVGQEACCRLATRIRRQRYSTQDRESWVIELEVAGRYVFGES